MALADAETTKAEVRARAAEAALTEASERAAAAEERAMAAEAKAQALQQRLSRMEDSVEWHSVIARYGDCAGAARACKAQVQELEQAGRNRC